jgi:hypothetical protein
MTQYDDIVVTPVYGPLSTSQTAGNLAYHQYGVLSGIRPTPPQFFPYQDPPYAEENTNARHQYLRTTGVSQAQLAQQIALAKRSRPTMYQAMSSQRQYPVSTHTNYIAPIPSSMYLNERKSIAIGKSAYKVGLPISAPICTKNYYPSGTRSSLRRARSGGCVAPAKKGSTFNTSLCNGAICGWGSVVRQTY